MWRVLGIILNPLGALFIFVFGWLGRKIDSWLSPAVGLVAALLVALWAVSLSTGLLLAMKDEIGRTAGLIDPPAFTEVDGRVEAILGEVALSRNRISQHLLVSYPSDSGRQQFDDRRSTRRASALSIGDNLPVYLVENRGPSLKEPVDEALEMFMAFIAIAVSLLVYYWAWRYGRYRWRIFNRSRSGPVRPAASGPVPAGPVGVAPPQPAVLRGREQPLSTAGRMKADAERVQRTISAGARR